jgi:hypothetical protein
MTDTNFPLNAGADMDDLPRTLRREREAREREARERAPSGLEAQSNHVAYGHEQAGYPAEATYPAAVRRFEVPFLHLVAFFLKAVIAALPALVLLGAILWGFGQVLKVFFPELLHFQILIQPKG